MTGFAKGAAMIGPNMATMLGFVMSDAAVAPNDLHRILKGAVEQSFNCISVEGHTSTNDTVFLLANATGPATDPQPFAAAVHAVCADLSAANTLDSP